MGAAKENITIRYFYTLKDGSQETFTLELSPDSMEIVRTGPRELPSWTDLEFRKCPHCPLTPESNPHCPLAANLVNIVRRFDGMLSHDEIRIDVMTAERFISQDTTAQRAISSLMGLVMATSGCPHTAFFRPMARFHLPLASKEETIYRASSMYMLAQYLLYKEGKMPDLEMEGLKKIYHNLQIVNVAILERLRSATETDSSTNAVLVLDIYAKTIQVMIDEELESIRHLFNPFFERSEELVPPPPKRVT